VTIVREIKRMEFIEVVNSYIGTPVVHRGRLPHVGLDCVGLPICALRALGMRIDEPPYYGKIPSQAQLTEGLQVYCEQMPPEERVPGDLLQVFAGRQARHVLVYTGRNDFGQQLVVHAWGRNAMVQRAILTDQVLSCWSVRGMH